MSDPGGLLKTLIARKKMRVQTLLGQWIEAVPVDELEAAVASLALSHPPQEAITRYLDAVDSYLNIDRVTGLDLEARFRVLDNYREAKHKLLQELAALPHPQEQEPHRDCHDLVCNGNRNYPRGEPGHSCSCRGRDLRNVAASPPSQDQEP